MIGIVDLPSCRGLSLTSIGMLEPRTSRELLKGYIG